MWTTLLLLPLNFSCSLVTESLGSVTSLCEPPTSSLIVTAVHGISRGFLSPHYITQHQHTWVMSPSELSLTFPSLRAGSAASSNNANPCRENAPVLFVSPGPWAQAGSPGTSDGSAFVCEMCAAFRAGWIERAVEQKPLCVHLPLDLFIRCFSRAWLCVWPPSEFIPLAFWSQ